MVVHCKSCVYWEIDEIGSRWGACHRYPPTQDEWPEVKTEEWCGEGKYKKKSAEKKSEDPGVKKVIDFYHKAFVEKFEAPPAIAGGKDGNSVRSFLEDHSVEDAERLIVAFFDDPPSFFEEKGLYGLSHIIGAHNQMIVKMSRKSPKKGIVDTATSKLVLDEAHSWGSHPRYPEYCRHVKEMNESIGFEAWLNEYTA